MANGLTPSLPSGALGWLSKTQVGGTVYAIKDAALRAMLDTAATKEAITSIITEGANANNTNDTIPTTAALVSWLEQQIQGLTGAMHFAGVTDPEDGETPAERIEALYGENSPEAGDIVIDGTTEYVYDGSAWKELGDEGVYATKGELADAIADIVIAGVTMGSDNEISAQELKTALGLGDFAFVNTGSASYDKATGASLSDAAAAGTYTISGTAVSVPQTFSAMDVTPAGEVTATASTVSINVPTVESVSYVKTESASYDKVSSIAVSSAAPGAGESANYTPAGSISLPSFTGEFTASTTSVATVTDAGTAYTINGGGVSQAAATSASFAVEGVTAAMDATDNEMLVFSVAGTTNAVTEVGALTFTTPTLSGALPTFGNATVATGGTVGVAANGDASFTGTGALISAAANFTSTAAVLGTTTTGASLGAGTSNIVVPAQSITASFTGTSNSVTPQVATSANAAPSDAQVTVAGSTASISLTYTTTTITVNPVTA